MGDMMLLKNPKFLQKIKLNLITKLVPLNKPGILLLDILEIALKEAKVNQVSIQPILYPQITSDFCPARPEIITPILFLKSTTVEDLSLWLSEQFASPGIESFSVALDIPRTAGKVYRQSEEEDNQDKVFEFEEDKYCIHGLNKKWCNICIKKERQERQERERISRELDPFDIILPILFPPLGENFDNQIAFPKDLFPHQREGVKFLVNHERALLGDDMGLGKTQQAITALRFLIRMGKITNALVLCPKSVLPNWERELWDWAPELRIIKVHGTKEQRMAKWNCPAQVYLTTYETLRQDLTEDIAKKEFNIIILDEIQKIKNPDAAITKAVRKIKASYRWGLSGTPLENRLEELISIFSYLKPGLLHNNDASSPLKVKEAIKPYFLRRRKTDALLGLPEKVNEEIWLELSPSQRETYDRAEKEGIIALNEKGDSVTVQHILALITKLKQICNIDPVTKESCKLEYLLEKLEEITEENDKALVFSQYPEKTIKLIEPKLRPFNPLFYHGSLSDAQRDQIVKRFQEDEQCKVLLMSVKAGSLGLTLTRANYVFHFDLWWNPSIATQAEDRAHRIGQEKKVFVISLFTVDTIEEKIQTLFKRKRELFKEVIDDLTDANLSRVLTEEELFGLFNLQKSKAKKDRIVEIKITPESLKQILPQQFEQLIGNLFEKMGYHVRLTPRTKDRGIDILAKRSNETGIENLAIQCKHYPGGRVGVEHARSLYGVMQDNPEITKGVLVTSGEFSKDCKNFANGKRIELFDGKYLCGLLEKYGVSFFPQKK